MPDRHGVDYTTDAGRRYDAYIGSRAWARKRLAYWRRYGRLCQVTDCGATSGLHVHHHTYARLGDEWLTDLVGLCKEHHRLVHEFHEREGGSLTVATEKVTGIRLRVQRARPEPVVVRLPEAACHGSQVGQLDTGGRPRGSGFKRQHLTKAQEKVAHAQMREQQARRHAMAQEVARRLATK